MTILINLFYKIYENMKIKSDSTIPKNITSEGIRMSLQMDIGLDFKIHIL